MTTRSLPEVMRRIEKQREDSLRWERADLGWAISLFRAGDEPSATESPERP